MNTVKKISSFLSYLVLFGSVLFIFEECGNAQCLQEPDPIITRPEANLKNPGNKLIFREASINFYKTDSIFSIHSQKGYLPSLFHDIGQQASAPFHFTKKQWLYAGAAAGITTALLFADEDIDKWARVQKQKHLWVDRSSPVISEFGSKYGIYTVVAEGLLSAVFKNEKGVQTSLMATQAVITSGLWTQIIKQLTGRERPKASYIFSHQEGGKWHGAFAEYFEANPDNTERFSYDSFPSGHTATAFAIATVFASQYNENKVVPVILYSAASLVGVSRMTEHEHWASDVFVGGLLGYLSGKQVVHNYYRTHHNSFDPAKPEHVNNREIKLIQYENQIGFLVVWH